MTTIRRGVDRVRSRSPDRGDVEPEAIPVADEHVPAAQRLVERHPVVRSRELPGDLEPDALVAPRVDVCPLHLSVQDDLVGDAVDGQPAAIRNVCSSSAAMAVDSKRQLRVLPGVKKSGERRCSSRCG